MNKVIVLMSTYNGEKYIKQQIDSILMQKSSCSIELLIRDDGSRDQTITIIESEIFRYKNIENRNLVLHCGQNVGPARSFMRLINKCGQADYYFLADQDDIWDLDKVERAREYLNKSKGKICLYTSAYRIVDEMGKVIAESKEHSKNWLKPLRTLYFNETPGCSIAFNQNFLQEIRKGKFDKCMMHDSLLMLFAAVKGEIIYDVNPRFSYRIHSKNTLGLKPKKKNVISWLVEKINLLVHGEDYDLSEIADKILLLEVKEEYKKDIMLIRDCNNNIIKKMKLLLHKDMHSYKNLRWRVSVFFHILFNLY